MKKAILFIALLAQSLCFAECTIKPDLLTVAKTTSASLPFENIIAFNLSIFTPPPEKLSALTPILIFNDNKTISFDTIDEGAETYTAKELYLKVLGATPSQDDTVSKIRMVWNINCSNLPHEIKLKTADYRVFLVISTPTMNNLFIVPSDKDKQFVYFVQFNNFNKESLSEILATINSRGR